MVMKQPSLLFGILLSICFLQAGCMKPYDVPEFVEIKPNETAFLIALEGDAKTNQAKFQSVEYLDTVKVATKRVQIPHREISIGRWRTDVKYIPTVKLITVDRIPVTRSWTQPGTGTNSTKDEAIQVESQDSVGFGIGVTCTAAIEEADAAKFLYNYAGRTLHEIMDSDVRNWIQAFASTNFGNLPLNECQKTKGEIFIACEKEAKEFFKTYGITIRKLGYAEGMTYENKDIQKQIDDAFAAELQKKVAEQERQAQTVRNQQNLELEKNTFEIQTIRNQQDLAIAQNKRAVAEEFAKAAEAQKQIVELEVRKMTAQALVTAAEKWQGGVPSMMVMGQGKDGGFQMPMIMPFTPPTTPIVPK
jgi:hypothetical protein